MTQQISPVDPGRLLGVLRGAICKLPECGIASPNSIAPQHSLSADFGIDSVSVIELGFYIEQSVGAEIDIVAWFEDAAPEHTLVSLYEHVLANADGISLSAKGEQ